MFFSPTAIFVLSLHTFKFNPFSKMFCSFSLKLNIDMEKKYGLALWFWKMSNKLNIKAKEKIPLTCRF